MANILINVDDCECKSRIWLLFSVEERSVIFGFVMKYLVVVVFATCETFERSLLDEM